MKNNAHSVYRRGFQEGRNGRPKRNIDPSAPFADDYLRGWNAGRLHWKQTNPPFNLGP